MHRSVLPRYLTLFVALIGLLSLGAPASYSADDSAKPAKGATPATDAGATTSASPGLVKELSTHGQSLDRVVAIVNDGVVMQSELEEQVRGITARLRAQNVALPPSDVLRSQVLDRLVLEEIQAQRADRAGIKVSDDQVNAALDDIAKRQNVTLAQLPERMAAEGLEYSTYRGELKREIARQLLRSRDVVQRIVVTPRELDQYMEREKRTATAANEYNVSHILIAVAQDATPVQRAQANARAEDILRRARAGEDFSKLAVTYSQAETALEGGSLGWRKGSELPTFVADMVVRLKPGDISDVMQTPTGYHLVKLNEQRSLSGSQIVHQVHLRHILIKTTEIEDDATVQQKLTHMRDQILAGKDEFAVLAKTNSQDPGSAVNGGDLGWAETSNYVPAFAEKANALKDGEISTPFKSEYGWHIVQMLGRRDFDNSRDAARERAFQALRDSRVEEATELWLQQIRDESFVELRPLT